MYLVQPLPEGPLDIVGDIHGEYQALCLLLKRLGYDDHGDHPDGRTLVFVGDLCDRGPDSPAVLTLVQRLVEHGRAVAILGNHEINLLRHDAKDGAGWYFDQRMERDATKYAPFQRPDATQRQQIRDFLVTLPVALERDDLRVVHAAWQPDAIAAARRIRAGAVLDQYEQWETQSRDSAVASLLAERLREELQSWPHGLDDPNQRPPFLLAHAQSDIHRQMHNPLKVLTSGIEVVADAPFYSSGKWRFTARRPWWEDYDEATPVIVGHYWRRMRPVDRRAVGKGDADLFAQIAPLDWHGKHRNVFCIDYSVGGRWTERKQGTPVGRDFRLAAMRWPERTVVFDISSGDAIDVPLPKRPRSEPSALG